jgi:hypothetical protein
MPLALTDPRWSELRSSYGDTEDVVAWLTEAYSDGMSDERLGDLVNEVQHQGGTCTAMYAVAPHLIELASRMPPDRALEVLTHAGLIYANSDVQTGVACPEFLKAEFAQFGAEGAKLLAPLLTVAKDFDSYKWGVAGLAGFVGQNKFARFLEGLDYFEGQFYHQLIDGPFPSKE